MGKLLAEYMVKYKAAIAGAKPGDRVAPSELWIAAMWEQDNGVNPWEPEYKVKLDDAAARDPELGEVLFKGVGLMMEIVKKTSEQKEQP